MKIVIRSINSETKEVSITVNLTLRKGTTTEQAQKIAKIEVMKMSQPSCWELK